MVQLELAIDDALARYLADCRRRNLRPATIFYYQTAITRFAAGRCTTLAGFTRSEVHAFQDASFTLSAGSMKGYLTALRTFSAWLFDEDLLESDPLAKLALPIADQRIVEVPSDRELLSLLDVASPPLRVVVDEDTGCRVQAPRRWDPD